MKALKNKSKGNEVKILQLYLNVTCDGKFGPKTEAAVNGWKNENGMNPDGIFSETDWGILVATLPTIQQGIKSKFVKMWQLFLGVTADGVFGSKTAATTKTYQASAGLTIDGVVGRQTWLMAFTGKTENPVSTAPQQTTTTNKKPIDYKQYDSRWGSIKYSTHTAAQTIRNSGCGPSGGMIALLQKNYARLLSKKDTAHIIQEQLGTFLDILQIFMARVSLFKQQHMLLLKPQLKMAHMLYVV